MSAIVVGGGVSGLLAAWSLTEAGHECIVLERDRLGGMVRSADIGGFTADVGAEAFSVLRPEAAALMERLGLQTVAPRRSDARLSLDDVISPLPARTLLGIPADPRADDVRAILDDAAVTRALDDLSTPVSDPLPASLGELVRARMGSAVVARLVDPVVRGVHATRADDVDVDVVAPGLRAAVHAHGSLSAAVTEVLGGRSGSAGSAVRSIEGGMSRLVQRLIEVCGCQLAESVDVTSVRHIDGRWQVHAEEFAWSADTVVMATPGPVTARLLGDAELGEHLQRIPLGDVVVVALRVRSSQLDADPVGSGALIARSDVSAKGLTHASAKWQWIRDTLPAGEHLVRLSYGRDGDDPWSLVGADPVATALADLSTVAGVDDLELLDAQVQPWPHSLTRPLPGHAEWSLRLGSLLTARPGLHIVGPGVSGNGIAGAYAAVERCARLWA